MFKRLFWFSAGVAAGVVGVKKVEAALQERLETYSPPAMARSVGVAARELGEDVRDAVRYGRNEMRRTELELRSQHEPVNRRDEQVQSAVQNGPR